MELGILQDLAEDVGAGSLHIVFRRRRRCFPGGRCRRLRLYVGPDPSSFGLIATVIESIGGDSARQYFWRNECHRQCGRSANASARGKTRLRVLTAEHMRLRIRESDPVVRLLVQVLLDRFRNEQKMHRGRLTAPPEVDDQSLTATGPRLVEDTAGAIAKMRMETSIQEALEKEQLELWYQPIVTLKDNAIAGFEALIRWRHPLGLDSAL